MASNPTMNEASHFHSSHGAIIAFHQYRNCHQNPFLSWEEFVIFKTKALRTPSKWNLVSLSDSN